MRHRTKNLVTGALAALALAAGPGPAAADARGEVMRYVDPAAPERGTIPFTYETYTAEASAYGAVQTAVFSSAGAAATGTDLYDDATEGEGGGRAAAACDVQAQKPRGYADWSTRTIRVEVTADVWCNFTSPRIDVKVLLRGYDMTGSVGHYSREVACYGYSCTVTAYYAHSFSCSDGWEWMYYGVPYGSYKLKSGATRTPRGSGEPGPRIAGYGWNWC